jgi:NAD-dependent dihydropyrimidine dehydrogenase PreA subunit
MGNKGQILALGEKDTRTYLLVPYIPGVWEFQVNRMDKEFAEECEAYYPFQAKEMYRSATAPVRVIAVEKNIPRAFQIYPFEAASRIVKESKKIALADCICRKHNKLLAKGCQKPHEGMCIYLSPLAEFFIEHGWGKEASVDDALQALERGEEAGLVRTAWLNVQKNPTGLCQCCPCCCHALRAVYELKIPNALAKSNFVPVIDMEACTGCESCVDICPMDALLIDGNEKTSWNSTRCIGCGLCVSRCLTGAIRLERVSEGQTSIPPETYSKLMTAIAHEKGKTYFHR